MQKRKRKKKENVSHRQNNDAGRGGDPARWRPCQVETLPVRSSLCTSLIAVSTAARSKVTTEDCPKSNC